ncbi:galactokinase [Rubellicoccus peritrichatus]|uniref:Galactokinase n=1 Tax=Rubellicoccus peritrichatus TaxID=3080537 RepID=A0AAQ3L6J2_9BACT|nr:galactokinase [Puniceicoccus sp. CR14]WOO40001.1 galactokinase [Puniceicoccus sp. CR14]
MDPVQTFKSFYSAKPEVVTAAPGRLEFVGNHTDYNGGLVMGVAVDRGIRVAASKRTDGAIILRSEGMDSIAESNINEIKPLNSDKSWANYALGVFDELRKAGMSVSSGFEMSVSSDLPYGAGMSSSAAFELSSGLALGSIYGFETSTANWARIGRRAENNFVGMPCGILDQGVSAFGQRDHIVRIDCKAETFDRVSLPHGVHFWVFNTSVKHALVDSLYATRHKECTEAFEILKQADAQLECLADASPQLVEENKAALGEVCYKRARHVTEETQRVREMETALSTGDLKQAGALLFGSHDSSQHLFENSCPELDLIVEKLKGIDSVYGARLTGGGFGGAVMAVTSSEFDESFAEELATEYGQRFDHKPAIFHTQSGDGARVIS